MKRFVGILLVALVAMLSCVRAEEGLQDAAKPDEALEQNPPGVSLIGEKQPLPKEQFYGGGGGGFIPTGGISYRYRFTYPYAGGFRYGWRYPMHYWYPYGRALYGSSCMFGRPYGGFYYC
ncbi:hypothetical protein BBJ28_00002562 [Nothophytophthora sp. Chile5]|nr:hypothetical protein BBJ28_00002562 [Nothophytophthora sp. Chile5]